MDDERIDSLIITVKAVQTIKALENVKHRLTPDSTILFLQNGMGILEEVNEKIFPDPATRPNYLVGTTTHGLYRLTPFKVVHAGLGTTILGDLNLASDGKARTARTENDTESDPENETESDPITDDTPQTTRHLIQTLTRSPALTALHFDSVRLLQVRLEKLAMNSVINPLTVLYDCRNGELLYNFFLSRVMRLLLIEISAVICAMPELQGVSGVHARFSPERLRLNATTLINRTSGNKSSMLHDVHSGRQTEVEYMNGYIVKKGDELGIKCALNYMMMQLIFGMTRHLSNQSAAYLPVDPSQMKEYEAGKM